MAAHHTSPNTATNVDRVVASILATRVSIGVVKRSVVDLNSRRNHISAATAAASSTQNIAKASSPHVPTCRYLTGPAVNPGGTWSATSNDRQATMPSTRITATTPINPKDIAAND